MHAHQQRRHGTMQNYSKDTHHRFGVQGKCHSFNILLPSPINSKTLNSKAILEFAIHKNPMAEHTTTNIGAGVVLNQPLGLDILRGGLATPSPR